MSRFFLTAGALLAGLAVVLGAFGAHALEGRFPPDASGLATFETGVRYQMYHALALLLVGWAAAQFPAWQVTWAGYLFMAGIALFSGSLYLLVLADMPWLGALTPLGGALFIAAWGLLAWTFLQSA